MVERKEGMQLKKERKREAQADVIEEKNKFEVNKEKRFWREKRYMGREKGKKVWEKTRCKKKFP